MLKKDLYTVAGVVYYIYEKCHEMLKKKKTPTQFIVVLFAAALWLLQNNFDFIFEAIKNDFVKVFVKF